MLSSLLSNPEIIKVAVPVIGGVIATGAGYFIRGYFDDRREEAKGNTKAISEENKERLVLERKIVSMLDNLKSQHARAYDLLKDRLSTIDKSVSKDIAALSVKIEALERMSDSAIREVNKQDGKISQHMDLIAQQISMQRAINDKFAAIFQYIDAPERSTDRKKPL